MSRANTRRTEDDPLSGFHPATQAWFRASFPAPTEAQRASFGPILEGHSILLLAPTGSGKTLAAFLAAVDRAMFSPEPPKAKRCRVLYVSPLKALAVDVERNLQVPLLGIQSAATQMGASFRNLEIGMRSGDTPAKERARISRTPPDIMITTPESLYLLLTSNARQGLASVSTVIIDEIHAVAGTKRGAHLALSLERLEALRLAEGSTRPLQRIGLSATQRPLEEIASLLGGGAHDKKSGIWTPRPVAIIDATTPKTISLSVEVPVTDMSRLGTEREHVSRTLERTSHLPENSIWPHVQARLLDLVRAHRSTMIFVNSRRLAERLAAAINDAAEDEVSLAHHGSLAREQRESIEARLKSGDLPCIVATSSLELGLDLGAVDLVVQIETPPTISSGLQRVGRAGHQVGATSRGIILPKHRADLLASAAAVKCMHEREVEPTFYPRCPLDVLAQHIVAIVAMDETHVDALFDLVRRAANFRELGRTSFENLLDMLSGRYPSDDFAELRPRITWDREKGLLRARRSAKQLAVVNAGVIPDRGLYGVFLAGDDGDGRRSRRIGELDEEMVFEARAGEVFLLGASSWRITEITHDRVLVEPAPGQPGKMPFWRGDGPGRSMAFGQAIGRLARELAESRESDAVEKLRSEHRLDSDAALNLVRFVHEQARVTGTVPSDRTLVIERLVDELGDHRICIMSPVGTRIHAPLSICIAQRLRKELDLEVETVFSDNGIVLRLPEGTMPQRIDSILPREEDVQDTLFSALGGTALFASRFRECAQRALLLPKRQPGKRAPLWAQRRRAATLLEVASRFESFPILLETYRECLRDVFDIEGLTQLLRSISEGHVRVVTMDTQAASPFAASLLFSYAANFVYDNDAPLAERRARALSVDSTQLRELLGEVQLRDLLDETAILELEAQLQHRHPQRAIETADGVHDLLLLLGDLDTGEIIERIAPRTEETLVARSRAEALTTELVREHRALPIEVQGHARFIAVEDASRLRDALGIRLPSDTPIAFLDVVPDPLGDLVSRWARTHGPFRSEDIARRFGVEESKLRPAIDRLVQRGRLVEGAFTPKSDSIELCDVDVLRSLKRRSLSKLRAQVEPVRSPAFARFLLDWHGMLRPSQGRTALISAIERLEGAPVIAEALEREILPLRVSDYRAGDLDSLVAEGILLWRGLEPLSQGGGRVAFYFSDSYPLLAPPPRPSESALAIRVREVLARRGALFFSDIQREIGGFPANTVAALWELVWAGEVTSDTLAPLRAISSPSAPPPKRNARMTSPRARLFQGPPGSEGRWSLLPALATSEESRRVAMTNALLARHGVLTREAMRSENIAGGFGAIYQVLRLMEDSGTARRGMFISELGPAQFASPGVVDRLRAHREPSDPPRVFVLGATDPAQPFGAVFDWPARDDALRPARTLGAQVFLREGQVIAWLGRTERNLLTFLPAEGAEREDILRALAANLAGLVGAGRRRALLLETIDGHAPSQSALANALLEAGFSPTQQGFMKRAPRPVLDG
jgi:ATP-dependent Lhr-like helicase